MNNKQESNSSSDVGSVERNGRRHQRMRGDTTHVLIANATRGRRGMKTIQLRGRKYHENTM